MRSTRYLYWIVRDLTFKYTRSLLFGFLIGFFSSMIFWHMYPTISKFMFIKTRIIGLVGEYTPVTLPLSIQNELSTGMTVLKPDGGVGPGLASWWESSSSGKFYRFHLRQDAVWQNGKFVTASDINYNIKNAAFNTIDSQTVEVTLDYPYSPFPILVTKPIFKPGLIGFGTYKITNVKLKGDTVQSLRLVPVGKSEEKDALQYKFYRTEEQIRMAFKLGQIDEMNDLLDPADLADWKNVRITSQLNYYRIVALYFNVKNPKVSDKNFRQALGYALPPIDVEQRAYSPISKISWVYTDKIRKFEPDNKQVKKLIESASIATSSPELTLSTFSPYLDMAQSIAASWSAIGVKTSVKVENSLPDTYDVVLSAVDIPPDPDQYPLWHSSQNITNITGYMNVKIDKLLEDGRQEMDPENRKKIYADFARYLVDDAPAIFLYFPKTYSIKRLK